MRLEDSRRIGPRGELQVRVQVGAIGGANHCITGISLTVGDESAELTADFAEKLAGALRAAARDLRAGRIAG